MVRPMECNGAGITMNRNNYRLYSGGEAPFLRCKELSGNVIFWI